jgi:nucleoid-associated protein YgaU
VPVPPDSPFAQLPVLQVAAPDGSPRQVIALRLVRPVLPLVDELRVQQAESIDLLARRLYGDERLWWRILDANALIYPLDIRPGHMLRIPAPGPATRVTRARSF